MRRAAVIALIVLAFPGTAWAHATLLHTSPNVLFCLALRPFAFVPSQVLLVEAATR